MLEQTTSNFCSSTEEGGEQSIDSRTNLEKPGRLSDEEARYLLERGPYIGRLQAAQKLSRIVLAYSQDVETRDFISQSYVQSLTDKVTELSDELEAFDSENKKYEHAITMDTVADEIVEVDSTTTKPAKITETTGSFIKRREGAVCSETDPEAFFPEKGGSTKVAKQVCLLCELKDECLNYALENNQRFGIWGGLSERERRKLKKQQVA